MLSLQFMQPVIINGKECKNIHSREWIRDTEVIVIEEASGNFSLRYRDVRVTIPISNIAKVERRVTL